MRGHGVVDGRALLLDLRDLFGNARQLLTQ
jgi:hypothetical protein